MTDQFRAESHGGQPPSEQPPPGTGTPGSSEAWAPPRADGQPGWPSWPGWPGSPEPTPAYPSPQPYPPTSPDLYWDPQAGVWLPNGTALASVGRRIGAYFLAIPLAIVTLGIGYVIWGLVVWGRGQTPALQVLGMRCWRPDDGRPAGFWWMALREIIGRLADGILVITEVVSFILFVVTARRQSLHDLIAGTVVLHYPDKRLG